MNSERLATAATCNDHAGSFGSLELGCVSWCREAIRVNKHCLKMESPLTIEALWQQEQEQHNGRTLNILPAAACLTIRLEK